jgi:hypothetical protein
MNMDKNRKKLSQLCFIYDVTLGCDPEFFFTSKGEITGSEKILPKNGLTYDPTKRKYAFDGAHTSVSNTTSKVVIDGVQAELNPRPNTCRANLGNEISCCFRDLYEQMGKDKNGLDIEFKPLVKVTQKEMDSLSEKSKIFGCAPSTNIHEGGESKIKVDPKKYLKRSAGGHIHLGAATGEKKMATTLKNTKVMVPMLDIVVGNTCVLLDRNSDNIERRKNYGKVGEFREKPYGMEYRTLSNFWLQSYQLMSLVMGLSRLAAHMVSQSTNENDYVAAIFGAVDMKDIIKAVQTNDFNLALSNFKKIEPILLDAIGYETYSYPFNEQSIKYFYHFIGKGLNYWFKENPLKHWITLPEGHGTGWETFLTTKVAEDFGKGKIKFEDLKAEVVDLNVNNLADKMNQRQKALDKIVKEVAMD